MNATHRLSLDLPEDGPAMTATQLDDFVRSWPDEAQRSDVAIEVRLSPGNETALAEGLLSATGEHRVVSISVSWLEEL